MIIACAIFFMVGFAILELCTRSLGMAKALSQKDPDPGIIASFLSATNAGKLEEGSQAGTFEDIAPNMYPGYRWECFIEEQQSNGLFRADIVVYNDGAKKQQTPQTLSILLYRPGSPSGSRFGSGSSRRP